MDLVFGEIDADDGQNLPPFDPTPDLHLHATYQRAHWQFPQSVIVKISGLTRARDIWTEAQIELHRVCPDGTITMLTIMAGQSTHPFTQTIHPQPPKESPS